MKQKREATTSSEDLTTAKKKRKRRKAVEIDRAYKCSLGNCRKVCIVMVVYGSET